MDRISDYQLDLFFVFSTLFCNIWAVRATYPQCQTLATSSCDHADTVTLAPKPTTTVPGEYSWEHSEMLHYVFRNCFCDELCIIFDDCCSDYVDIQDTEEAGYGNLLVLYRKHLKLSPQLNLHGYHTAGPSKREAILGTAWIKTCPSYFQTQSVKKLCEDDSDTFGDKFLWWPVSNKRTGIMYRNMYCAMCWDDNETVFWEISVGCTYVNPDYPDYQFNSLMADPLMADSNEYSRPKRSEYTTAPGVEPGVSEADPAAADVTMVTPIVTTATPEKDILTKLEQCQTYLMNPFGVKNIRYYKLEIISKCPTNWTDKSLAQLCSNYTYIIHDNSTINKLYKNAHCAKCHGVALENIVCDWKDLDAFTAQLGYFSSMQPFYPITVLFEPQGGKVVVTDDGNAKDTLLHKCEKNEIFDIFERKCRKVFCAPRHEFINGSCTRTTIPTAMAFLPTQRNDSGAKANIVCPSQVKYDPGEFKILENGNILISGLGQEFNASDVRFSNGSIFICAHHVTNRNISIGMVRTVYKFETAAMIISAAGQIFSIVCLAVNFVVYAILPPLRNTPGKTLMSLVLALFFSQLTFLVGAGRTNDYICCVLAATLIHYFILASFVWMNALSLDLALAFSATNLHNADEKTKRRRFIAFSLYGWISPLLVVGISLLLDLFGDTSGEFTPRYGRHICWISNPSAVGLLFILPLAVLLTVNVILYIFTAINIYRATVAAEMVRKRDRRSLLIYIKLSVIMGGTWIFAFVWIVTKSAVVQYTFIILNSLQGAFIFFSFVFRRKVYHMLRQYYGSERKRSTSSTGKAANYSITTDANNRLYTINPQIPGTAV